MNLKLFADEIARFLRSPEPELLCISGAWGAGKTFAWKHYLEVAQKEKAVSYKKYAYVSLFGRNSLEDVRTAIVENTVDSGIVGGTPDLSSYENSLGLFEAGAKKLAKYAGFLPQASGYAASANRVLFMLLKEQIVCIDDLERAGKGLDSRTVLGLASDLKEQKNCKVVLLLNEESLEGDDKKEFEGQIEKVADAVLLFKPTPDECAAIGIDDGTPLAEELRAAAVALKIVNIRVIRKAQRVWMRASEILQTVDQRIKKQAVSTVMLATYSRFQPKIAPPLDLIKQYNSFEGLFSKQKIDPTVAAARETLRIYGFGHADEFDLVLIEAVESGFIDKDRLVEQAAKLAETMALADRTRSFSDAWDAFHNSVEDDADAVLDRIYKSFKTDLQAVTPVKLDGTIRTFKEFGREAQAKEMLDLYITNKVADSDFWDLMSSPLGGHVVDQEVREAFANKFSNIKPAFSPENFLGTLVTKNGWDPDELAEMAKLTADQYVAIFKKADGKTLSSIISAALYFRDVSNKDDQMTAMTSAAEEALRIIARENLLNRMRMQKFGIIIDDSPAGGDPTSGDVPLAEGSET